MTPPDDAAAEGTPARDLVPAPGLVPDPVGRVRAAYDRIARSGRPEVWITLREEADARAAAERVADRLRSEGAAALPLAGLVIAVKDNIDVAGLPTTAALPSSTYLPPSSAPAVERLERAGAVVIGKTNLDQLATGLVGSRSPYGAVRAAHDPTLVSGGSSAGSAVAVALGLVDAALGTDTAGSGRVPAAFNGIVGIKPTLGLVPARGVVPAAPSYDTVTVFAATVPLAERVAAVMAGVDGDDPTSRAWPATAPAGAPPVPRVAVPDRAALAPMSPTWRAGFDRAVTGLAAAGAQIVTVDIAPLLAAARLLYDGALVAERTFAVGHLLAGHPEGADPTVAGIITAGGAHSAVDLVRDQQALRRYRLVAAQVLAGVDALLIPTAPGHPTLAEVAAEPVAVNSWVGTYTNFVNLLDLAAVAIPVAGGAAPVGVTLVGPAFSDALLADLARRLTVPEDAAAQVPHGPRWSPSTTTVAVFGAHLTGQPLNPQLTDLGARLLGPVRTAASYRLHALATDPPKPGLVRDADGDGSAVAGELWAVPTGRVGELLAHLVQPMTWGVVDLDDGRQTLGFLCEPAALVGGIEITGQGSWVQHLADERSR